MPYDRQKFQAAWFANADHSPEGLKNFVASNPDFAEGVQFMDHNGQASTDKVTMPSFNDNGIQRGPESLDLIIDAGGGNHAGWSGVDNGAPRRATNGFSALTNYLPQSHGLTSPTGLATYTPDGQNQPVDPTGGIAPQTQQVNSAQSQQAINDILSRKVGY